MGKETVVAAKVPHHKEWAEARQGNNSSNKDKLSSSNKIGRKALVSSNSVDDLMSPNRSLSVFTFFI